MDLLNLVGLKSIKDSVDNLANNISQNPATSPNPQTVPGYVPPAPKEVYFSWAAEGRSISQSGNQKLTRSIMVIGGVIALFLVILQEYFLILVIASAIFVSSVLSKTPPEQAHYEISSYGVTVDGVLYTWTQLKKFFFTFQGGVNILAIDTVALLPSRLFLTLGAQDQAKVKALLEQHIPFVGEPPKDVLDKTLESVKSRFSM